MFLLWMSVSSVVKFIPKDFILFLSWLFVCMYVCMCMNIGGGHMP